MRRWRDHYYCQLTFPPLGLLAKLISQLYLPYTLVFLYQIHTLQRNQVRLRTTTTNNTATHEYNSRLRYQTYLIMAQVVLLLALAVSQIAPGVYIAAVEHQGPPSRTDEIMRTLLIGWSVPSSLVDHTNRLKATTGLAEVSC